MFKKIFLSFVFILLLVSCKKEEKIDSILALSYNQNPTLQGIDIEMGLRHTRKLEDTVVQVGFYDEAKVDINTLVPVDSGVDLLKFRDLYNIGKLNLYEKVKALNSEIVDELTTVYPKPLLELLKNNDIESVVPTDVYLYSMYINRDFAKTHNIKDLKTLDDLLEQSDNLNNIMNISSPVDFLKIFDLLNLNINGDVFVRGLNRGLIGYDSNEVYDLLIQYKKLYQAKIFTDKEALLYYLSDKEYLELDYNLFQKLERVNFLVNKKNFAEFNGYIVTGDSDNPLIINYLQHYISAPSEDYLYRVRGRIPLRKDFDVNRLTKSQKSLYDSIQESEVILNSSFEKFSIQERSLIIGKLLEMLNSDITISEYIELLDNLSVAE